MSATIGQHSFCPTSDKFVSANEICHQIFSPSPMNLIIAIQNDKITKYLVENLELFSMKSQLKGGNFSAPL